MSIPNYAASAHISDNHFVGDKHCVFPPAAAPCKTYAAGMLGRYSEISHPDLTDMVELGDSTVLIQGNFIYCHDNGGIAVLAEKADTMIRFNHFEKNSGGLHCVRVG